MPFSDPENKPWTAQKIVDLSPKTVLDVGAGQGVYLDIIRRDLGSSVVVDAVEAWKPYIDQFNLLERYNEVFIGDIRDYHFNKKYDLVIFGDILEHMSELDALHIWEKTSTIAKNAIISIPIVHYHQGAEFGNPYEVHVEEDWNTQRVLNSFKNIIDYKQFNITGTFIAKFGD